MTETTVWVAGTLGILLGMVLGLLCPILFDWIRVREGRAAADARERERAIIAGWAQWFSEDRATMEMLLRLGHGEDVSDVRQLWRQQRQSWSQSTTPVKPPMYAGSTSRADIGQVKSDR